MALVVCETGDPAGSTGAGGCQGSGEGDAGDAGLEMAVGLLCRVR